MNRKLDPRPAGDGTPEPTFLERALSLSGKGVEETRTTGTLDRADEQVEALFAPEHQTARSPIHRAVWDRDLPVELFVPGPPAAAPRAEAVLDRSLAVVRAHRAAGTLFDDRGKVSGAVLTDLAGAGYWGLLVDPEYGGQGAPFARFAPFLTRMATVDPTVAGLASVHGCIGAVDPLRTFGTPEQKRRLLPPLARGERLSAFALTEPGAGSDLTALRTTARREGGAYKLTGEKLFITNAAPGRTIGLVCKIEGQPAVLIAELPAEETEAFQVRRYGLFALRHAENNGLVFRDFAVPAENRLVPRQGDGLTIAYHGLNLGRVALCAAAAGTMRVLLANLLPWARFRRTYGAAIVSRELVERRIGRLAALITGCDALVAWCADLLDRGYRGELECIVAKVFGSEAQKEAAVELFMKTHGGRSFLRGHRFGEEVHEYLAPCIYEGEGEMLGMAFLKSLLKEHGQRYFEPIGRALADAGIARPNLADPRQVWRLRRALASYAGWRAGQALAGRGRPRWPADLPGELRAHAAFAAAGLTATRAELSGTMVRHQLGLADRQCRISELSQRVQDLVVMLTTSLWAAGQPDERVRAAADVLGGDLNRRLTGRRPSDADFARVTRLGRRVAAEGFPGLESIEPDPILMPYPDPGAGPGRHH